MAYIGKLVECHNFIGGLAHLARALAWHARGGRFESDILHKLKHRRYQSSFFMTYYVYILYSETINQYYVGQTQNIEERLQQHRNSRSKSTKKASDWVLVYSEVFAFRADSVNRESEIKKKKSRKYIENLIQKGSNTIG